MDYNEKGEKIIQTAEIKYFRSKKGCSRPDGIKNEGRNGEYFPLQKKMKIFHALQVNNLNRRAKSCLINLIRSFKAVARRVIGMPKKI